MTTLPPIQKGSSIVSRASTITENDGSGATTNPFSVPKGINIFTTLREQNRLQDEKHRKEMLSKPIHLKGTMGQRQNLSAATRHKIAQIGLNRDDLTEEQLNRENQRLGGVDAAWILKMTAGARRGGASAAFRSSRHDYINAKRQMFFAQYGLSVKKAEMKNLEKLARLEQNKIESQEQAMEDDSHAFDQFLKDSAKGAEKSNKIAENETKIKLEKQAEIKTLNLKKQGIKSQILRFEEELKEILTYRKFLYQMAPKAWQYENSKSLVKNLDSLKRRDSSATSMLDDGSRPATGNTGISFTNKRLGTTSSATTNHSNTPSLETLTNTIFDLSPDELDEAETPKIYFSNPVDVIELLHDLEEQNLCLIRNSQESEKSIEDSREKHKKCQDKIESELNVLKTQIEKMTRLCEKEEQQVSQLKLSCTMYNMGKMSEEQADQEKKLAKNVSDVYQAVVGDNAAQIETIQMLSSLEAKIENLFDLIETLPPEAVEAAEKARERERRLRNREEKAREQRIAAEARVKKALERAQESYKKRTGKKLVFRSDPPPSRQAKREKADRLEKEREREEEAYFFSY